MSPAPDPGGASRERRIPAATPDMELLRHYEPVIRYTQGEQFFPMDVVRYVAACNLWAHYPNGRDELLVRQEDLTIDSLADARPADFGTVHYLRFVENLSLGESADVLARQIRLRRRLKNTFHPGLGSPGTGRPAAAHRGCPLQPFLLHARPRSGGQRGRR